MDVQSRLSQSSVGAQSELQSEHNRSWFFTQNMKGCVSTKTHVMNKESKIFSGDTICVGQTSSDCAPTVAPTELRLCSDCATTVVKSPGPTLRIPGACVPQTLYTSGRCSPRSTRPQNPAMALLLDYNVASLSASMQLATVRKKRRNAFHTILRKAQS